MLTFAVKCLDLLHLRVSSWCTVLLLDLDEACLAILVLLDAYHFRIGLDVDTFGRHHVVVVIHLLHLISLAGFYALLHS